MTHLIQKQTLVKNYIDISVITYILLSHRVSGNDPKQI